ncbi:MAG: hypothetical protein AAF481_17015 [Acidobacteriota bacterium]
MWEGRNFVYINAFRSPDGFPRWQIEAVGVCDGGDDFWGAVYDPERNEFLQLAINGAA